jgi:hypothetical protein
VLGPYLLSHLGSESPSDTNLHSLSEYTIEDPYLAVDEIARFYAPIFWFSPEEPYSPMAIDDYYPEHYSPIGLKRLRKQDGVVYYRLTAVEQIDASRRSMLGSHGGSSTADTLYVPDIDRLILTYFSYYPFDTGWGGHRHDLESVDIELTLFHDLSRGDRWNMSQGYTWRKSRCRLTSVTGAAHGIPEYDNRLDVGWLDNLSLPITILVEEGKHASCPDRNADGRYTPGYDVNHGVEDAWGVRDALGSGHLGQPMYTAGLTKPPVRTDECT